MPPFAGTPEELESLVHFLRWSARRQVVETEPQEHQQVLEQIKAWMDEAGTGPSLYHTGE
jgi:cytochrome bd ubiquinol oxidase subunit I